MDPYGVSPTGVSLAAVVLPVMLLVVLLVLVSAATGSAVSGAGGLGGWQPSENTISAAAAVPSKVREALLIGVLRKSSERGGAGPGRDRRNGQTTGLKQDDSVPMGHSLQTGPE